MADASVKDWIYGLGALGVVWLLWAAKEKLTDAAASVADTIAKPVANAIIKFTLPEPVNVTGMAILPDGRRIPLSSIRTVHVPNTEIFYFVYQGIKYQLGKRSAAGNYPTRAM